MYIYIYVCIVYIYINIYIYIYEESSYMNLIPTLLPNSSFDSSVKLVQISISSSEIEIESFKIIKP